LPPSLRIGLDASRATSPCPTGTEIYSQRLIETLLDAGSPHRFRLYFRDPPPPGAFRGAEHRVIPFPRLWTHLRLSWEMLRHPPDLLFVPSHVLPLVRPSRTLVTIHDLGYIAYPEAHPRLQRLYLNLSTRWNARVATHIIADSKATRDDLATYYATPPEKVTVAYPGYDETLAPVRDPEIIAAAKARCGVEGDYLLHLGTLQPRKNLSRLVEAFAGVEANLTLILAGRRGWLTDDLFAQVQHLGLTDRVRFPGYIPHADKAILLSGALAFVFPSLHEGFGLPVLEAQACGCPVVCSNTSSLPEVAGDGAILLPPTDVAAWTEAIDRVAADPALQANLVERGTLNLQRFSWQRCADGVLAAIERLAGPVDRAII
jgi:glycosyltransferase involved in cell wall biosynthesis